MSARSKKIIKENQRKIIEYFLHFCLKNKEKESSADLNGNGNSNG